MVPNYREFENKFSQNLQALKYAMWEYQMQRQPYTFHLKGNWNWKRRSEVIVPDLTFVASANAILFTGATRL